MKGNRMYVDIGSMLDEIFDAAKNFSETFRDNFDPTKGPCSTFDHDENADWYPSYSYPPMNIYLTADRSIVFEFAVAGFDEKDISLSFQGDYMLFAARMGLDPVPEEGVRYFKRRLKLKDIEKQKYYVPADKFDQEKVKAVFRNGILKVSVPPKDTTETTEGVRIDIVKEGE
ncbi:MAG: Hsp20/alpha crystallin family protein [Spirochaetes bacterium]|nr:Hsp20/alpha crystallin family protein [Spirochaetota bacterium]